MFVATTTHGGALPQSIVSRPNPRLRIARILMRREFMVPAEWSARNSLELNPRLPLAHELLGEIDLAKSDIAQAIKEFQIELTLDPLCDGLRTAGRRLLPRWGR